MVVIVKYSNSNDCGENMKYINKTNLGLLLVILIAGAGIFLLRLPNISTSYSSIINIASSLDSALLAVTILLVIFSVMFYFRNLSNEVVEEQEEKHSTVKTYNSTMTKLDNYILSAIKQGHSKEVVRDLLINSGWDEYVVDMSLRKIESKRPR